MREEQIDLCISCILQGYDYVAYSYVYDTLDYKSVNAAWEIITEIKRELGLFA